MKYTENHGTGSANNVEHRVGKTVHKRAPNMMVNFRKRLGMIIKRFEHPFEGKQEVRSEGLAAIAISSVSLGQVGLRFGCESNGHSASVRRDGIVDQG